MAIYVINGEGQRFKVTGSGGGGIDEIPIATETTVGGIISSPDASDLFVDPNTGIASVNDNVSMNGAGMIILSGLGNEDGVHTIEFTNDPEPADVVAFDNTSTGMTATNVQSAIDEFHADYNATVRELIDNVTPIIQDFNVVKLETEDNHTQITNLQAEVGGLDANVTYIQNLLKYYSKENILDNWYFKSPINQFNKGSYTNSGDNVSAFDRWVTGGGATVSYVVNSHIHVSFPSADYSTWGQYIPFAFRYAGQQITVSCYCKQTSGTTSFVISNGINQLLNIHLPTEWTCVSYTLNIPDTNNYFYVGFQNQTQPSEFDVMYMKVEVNNQQTLMHKEGNIWVLNDTPPNEAEMLTRCARYLQVFGNSATYSEMGAYNIKTFNTDNNVFLEFQIPLITKMSSSPSVLLNNGFRLLYPYNNAIHVAEFVKENIVTYASYIEGYSNVINFNVILNGTLDSARNLGSNGFIDSGSSVDNYIALASPVE